MAASIFRQGLEFIHKPGFLNPTHATEWRTLEDQGSLVVTLNFHDKILQVGDIKQRTDSLHNVHYAVTLVARGLLNLAAAVTLAPAGALYHGARLVINREQDEVRGARLEGLKFDVIITLVACAAIGGAIILKRNILLLVMLDLRIPIGMAIAIGGAIVIGTTLRPYHGKHSSALAAYLLHNNFGIVQENGYPLNSDPNIDNDRWTQDAPYFPEYERSVFFRMWYDSTLKVVVTFRDMMGKDLDIAQAVKLFKDGTYQDLRQMAVGKGKDVAAFDEAVRQVDLARKMNLEMGLHTLTNSDVLMMEHRKAWPKEVVIDFFAFFKGNSKLIGEDKALQLLQPPENPLGKHAEWLNSLDLDAIPNANAKKFLTTVRELVKGNHELSDLRTALKEALFDAAADPKVDPPTYNRLKLRANTWFHPDKNIGWSESTNAQVFYKVIISIIDNGTAG